MSDTATASRDEVLPARTVAARAAVAAMAAAAAAIGLSVSPLGFFTLPASISGADLAPSDPWRLAVPALLVATVITATLLAAISAPLRRERALVTAWATTVIGVAATAATTAGARLYFGDTKWTSLLSVRVWPHAIAVLAAVAMGIAIGGLIGVLRTTRRPGPVAVAFGVGLVARTGAGWYQVRYDVAATALAVVALVAITLTVTELAAAAPDAAPEAGAGRRRAALAWAVPVGVYLALLAVEYAYRIQLYAVYGWNDDNLSSPLFRTAGIVYAVLAALCAGLVAYLAIRSRRFGLTAKAVLVTAATATALGIGGGGDGWLPGAATVAVGVVAVAVAAVVPVTWRRIPVLACVELAGIVGLIGGLVRVLDAPEASGPPYAIWVGSLIVAVTTLRSVRGAGVGPVAALGLLVFSVTPVAGMLAGGLLWRAAPATEVPAAFDRLVWVVLVGAMVPALVAVGFSASRVSDSAD